MSRRVLVVPLVAASAAIAVALPASAGGVGTHIYDGRDVDDGEFPQVAYVSDATGAFCTGTLVAPSSVLTAAHCLHPEPDVVTEPDDLQVVVGTDTREEREQATRDEGLRGVAAVDTHPDYDGHAGSGAVGDFVADLALLELDEPIDGITPATVAAEPPDGGEEGTVVGWGLTGPENTDGLPDRLQAATVTIRSPEACAELFDGVHDFEDDSGGYDPEVMLCAGEPDHHGPETCQGDSGGPLFATGSSEILGVTSFGSGGRCDGTGVGGYTLGAAYADWVFVNSADPDVAPTRLSSADRIATALDVAARWEPADTETVVLATARDFPDALAAGAYATARAAPLLLTEPDTMPAEVGDEIARLAPEEVVLLGGEGAVSEDVADAVAALGPEPDRIAGEDRYATAAALARAADAPAGEVLVASGEGFADAVSAGALLGTDAPPPLVLAREDGVPEASLDALAALDAERVTLVGGTAALGPEVADALSDAGYEVTRLAGEDRYATSAQVLGEALDRHDTRDGRTLVAATGEAYPDALAAGVLAGAEQGVLALVPPDGPPAAAVDALAAATWSELLVVGGEAALAEVAALRLAVELSPAP